MYFLIPNPIIIMFMIFIFYGIMIIFISSLTAIFTNRVIRIEKRIDTIKLLRESFKGLGIGILISVAILVLMLINEDSFIKGIPLILMDSLDILFLYIPTIAILYFLIRSTMKQI
jgi:hypothetical protein